MKRTFARIFIVGDVMTARGIDMIQKYSCDPKIYEDNGLNAHDYVNLAERVNGKIPQQRNISYIWGDAIAILQEKHPDVRIINLETSVTISIIPSPVKSIHYKMHPKNLSVLNVAEIDCCVLSNNHTADWGIDGLVETIVSLKEYGVAFVGAGCSLDEAKQPAILQPQDVIGRVLVFAYGHESSGIPESWKATKKSAGLSMIDFSDMKMAIKEVHENVKKHKKINDIAVLSIHWGENWGYDVDSNFVTFAHGVIDQGGIDIIHGHSSHHAKAIEVYNGKLIMYGAGDFINDYEGIGGHEEYRGDLALMYFADVECTTGKLREMRMVPTQMKQLRVHRASDVDITWLQNTMSRECHRFGCDVSTQGHDLTLSFTKL